MRSFTLKVALIAILGVATSGVAAERYIVQGFATGGMVGAGTITWTIDTLFFNSGTSDATVRLLDVSNGGALPGTPATLTIPPGRTASLPFTRAWLPQIPSQLWMIHADVPPEILISNALSIGSTFGAVSRPYRFGRTRVPVFSVLTSAGVPQYHLNTSLASPLEMAARLNVAVYNDGPTAARAHIEFRQHCDDALLGTRDLTVAAKTLTQFGPFEATSTSCEAIPPAGLGAPGGAVYTIVTVDQPSASFVSVITNADTPSSTFAVVGDG